MRKPPKNECSDTVRIPMMKLRSSPTNQLIGVLTVSEYSLLSGTMCALFLDPFHDPVYGTSEGPLFCKDSVVHPIGPVLLG